MKNLFATVSYSFDSFYNNLNTQGQMIFSTILFLIVVLCVLLFITYLIQSVHFKLKIKNLKQEKTKKTVLEEKQEIKKEESKTKISDIAKRVEDALKEEAPINLTNFEEDQEKTAIISIDELMARAKDLEIVEDEEPSNINYLEKYNLQPAEIEQAVNETVNKENKCEVKAFKVSQVISPIYGVKKEVIDKNN